VKDQNPEHNPVVGHMLQPCLELIDVQQTINGRSGWRQPGNSPQLKEYGDTLGVYVMKSVDCVFDLFVHGGPSSSIPGNQFWSIMNSSA